MEEIKPVREESVLDTVLHEALEDEFDELTRFVMKENIFEMNPQMSFALLTQTHF